MSRLVLHNGKIATMDSNNPYAQAIVIEGDLIKAVGSNVSIEPWLEPDTTIIDLQGKTVIPGLNDSHTHLIRGGLNYNLELRWEGVPSLADALAMLKKQAERTPAPQWVRVIGGWSEFQFAERRMPTLAEINQASNDTPVFIMHLYGRALLNQAAVKVLGFDANTPNPLGGEIQKDKKGNPTGLLIAAPSALILYSTLAKGPKLDVSDQVNSTRHFMRELNRLGVTSVIDAGGGGQNYPDDYEVINQLHEQNLMTVRIAYNLFAQNAGKELSDYEKWMTITQPGAGDDMFKMNGAGENLTWSAADFENFLEPRHEPAPIMESELEPIVELLATNEWPFRIHATYDETIDRFLSVFERVNGRQPFKTRFIIDHAETISEANIERVKALGGGIATQHRMAFQGEYFASMYGADAAEHTPPIAKMLDAELPVGAGTDATRVASYDPWISLYWMVTGKTLGGFALYKEDNLLSRERALRLWTHGSAWFSGDENKKGVLKAGFYADLAVLSEDYFTVDEEAIKNLSSVLTILGGKIVFADKDFSDLSPPIPPASPNWSPVNFIESPGQRSTNELIAQSRTQHKQRAKEKSDKSCHDGCTHSCSLHGHDHIIAWNLPIPSADPKLFWGALGCSCFAV